jgi:tRNA-Thr(GGU) m(6)t(6)A37 methyltransferase TsaA
VRPIGTIRSPWPQKFGVPRQAGLVPAAVSVLALDPDVAGPDAVRGLDAFSHVWVLFRFHAAAGSRELVRAPRLGGTRKVGVLASRSPHRPNGIGMSAVRLLGIEHGDDGVRLLLGGGDFLDGTPVLDVKPYLPWADALPDATAGWADAPPPRMDVRFDPAVAEAFAAAEADGRPGLREVLTQTLALDPRRAGARPGPYVIRVGDIDAVCAIVRDAWEVSALRYVAGDPVEHAPEPEDADPEARLLRPSTARDTRAG